MTESRRALSARTRRAGFACLIIASLPALVAGLGHLAGLTALILPGLAWAAVLGVLGALIMVGSRIGVAVAILLTIAVGGFGMFFGLVKGNRASFVLSAALLTIAAPRLFRLARDLGRRSQIPPLQHELTPAHSHPIVVAPAARRGSRDSPFKLR